MSKQTLRRVLGSPIYAGWLDSDFVGPEPVKGNWEPLVPKELFDRAQAALARPPQAPLVSDRTDFPLRRFVRCGGCERPITGSWSRGKMGTRYPYYRCHRCGGVNVRKEKLEAAFYTLLQGVRLKQSYVKLFKAFVLDVWEERRQASQEEVKAQEKEVNRLTRKRDRLLELLVAGTIDEDTYRRQRDQIKTQLALAKIDERASEVENLDIEAVLGFAEQILLEPLKMWSHASLRQKQMLQQLLFPRGATWRNDSFGTPATCCVIEYLRPAKVQKEHVG